MQRCRSTIVSASLNVCLILDTLILLYSHLHGVDVGSIPSLLMIRLLDSKLVYEVVSISSHSLICNFKTISIRLFIFTLFLHILLNIVEISLGFHLHASLLVSQFLLLLPTVEVELLDIAVSLALFFSFLSIKRSVGLIDSILMVVNFCSTLSYAHFFTLFHLV